MIVFTRSAFIFSEGSYFSLPHQSSMEHKNFVKLKKTQLFYFVIKLTEPFAVPKACVRRKTKRGNGIIVFVLIITWMLPSIFSEVLMSLSNKHNYNAFTRSLPAFLLQCIETFGIIHLRSAVIL